MLAELQADFIGALLGRTPALPTRLAAQVVPGTLGVAARLEVYRNNRRQTLGAALAAVYPTVHALVGEACFAGIALRFLAAHPSRSGNLHDWGEALPGFLATLAATADLPYLADVARLDWAWHAAFHAVDAAPAGGLAAKPAAPDPQAALHALAAAEPAQRADARLPWHPAARLLASCHPVFDLWRWHQMPGPDRPALQLPDEGQSVLVLRRLDLPHQPVAVQRTTPAEQALLRAFASGATLGDAFGAALALDARFDGPASLVRHLSCGLLGPPLLPGHRTDLHDAPVDRHAGAGR